VKQCRPIEELHLRRPRIPREHRCRERKPYLLSTGAVASIEGAPRSDLRGMLLAAAAVYCALRLWDDAAIALAPDGLIEGARHSG
jgi:hypothetical protein